MTAPTFTDTLRARPWSQCGKCFAWFPSHPSGRIPWHICYWADPRKRILPPPIPREAIVCEAVK